MIKSMTGYGKAAAILPKGKLTIEIRTLNGKSADISIKSNLLPKDKDLLLRQKIAKSLQRGTIDVFLTWEANEMDASHTINEKVAEGYIEQLNLLAQKSGSPYGLFVNPQSTAQILSSVVRMPDVIDSQKGDIIEETDWPVIEKAFEECLDKVNEYRTKEGEILYHDITCRVNEIQRLYDEVESYEGQRIDSVKERITKAAEDLNVKMDKDRFEQEMIFYLEKLDINEEKVRLRQHCKYFMDTINNEPYPGKKLGFIIQEMGREINTTGSKANHAMIQQLVVKMKDELEKMREQSMNVL